MAPAYSGGPAPVRPNLDQRVHSVGQLFQYLAHHLHDGGAEKRCVDSKRAADDGQFDFRGRSIAGDLLNCGTRHDGLALDIMGCGGLGAPVIECRYDGALDLGGFLAFAKLFEHHEDVPCAVRVSGLDPADVDGTQELPQRQLVFMHDGIANLERADLAAHSIPLLRLAWVTTCPASKAEEASDLGTAQGLTLIVMFRHKRCRC